MILVKLWFPAVIAKSHLPGIQLLGTSGSACCLLFMRGNDYESTLLLRMLLRILMCRFIKQTLGSPSQNVVPAGLEAKKLPHLPAQLPTRR